MGTFILTGSGKEQRKQTAQKLISAYESTVIENNILGDYLKPRTVPAADIPVLSASATAPASDATDPCAKLYYLFGSNLTAVTEMSVAQATLGKRFLRGFSPGALNLGANGFQYKMSSALNTYNTAGNSGIKSNGWGHNAVSISKEFYLDGDVVQFNILNGQKFAIWVNDRLLSAETDAVKGAGLTYDATNFQFNAASNHYLKIKFNTIAKRKIKLYNELSNGQCDIFTRNVSTITPIVDNGYPLEWVHAGDSYSTGTGASLIRLGFAEWMNHAFGHDKNFISVATGTTGLSITTQWFPGDATPANATLPSYYAGFYLNWQYCTPDIITVQGFTNDIYNSATLASRTIEFFTAVRNKFPNALIFCIGSTCGVADIANGNNVTRETTIKNALSSSGLDIIFIPIATSNTPLITGTGKFSAQTGDGNADLCYGGVAGSDSTHFRDYGHELLGKWSANRIYDELIKLVKT